MPNSAFSSRAVGAPSRPAWCLAAVLSLLLGGCGGGDAPAAAPAPSMPPQALEQALEAATPGARTPAAQDGSGDEAAVEDEARGGAEAGAGADAGADWSPDPAPWELEPDEALSLDFAARLAQLQAAATPAAEAGGDRRVKWNPGHYVALANGGGDPNVKKTLREIKRFPQVKGLLIRYGWRQLETRQDHYNFSAIDRDLALAAAQGKRLFIMVGTKAFKSHAKAVPDYMHTPLYSGGAYRIRIKGKGTLGSRDNFGENAALHDPQVRDRLIALLTRLGQRYNRHDAFEGVALNETAMGDMVEPLSRAQMGDYFTHLAQVGAAARRAFPNTVVMQFVNFPRPYMPALVRHMVASSVALGGPDTFTHDRDLNRYVYPLYDVAQRQVPIGPSVQAENYYTTYQHGPHDPPRVSDLHAFAQERLHANYLFWSRTLTRPLVPYRQVLRHFGSSAFPRDGAGGLSTRCPTTFAACVPRL